MLRVYVDALELELMTRTCTYYKNSVMCLSSYQQFIKTISFRIIEAILLLSELILISIDDYVQS